MPVKLVGLTVLIDQFRASPPIAYEGWSVFGRFQTPGRSRSSSSVLLVDGLSDADAAELVARLKKKYPDGVERELYVDSVRNTS